MRISHAEPPGLVQRQVQVRDVPREGVTYWVYLGTWEDNPGIMEHGSLKVLQGEAIDRDTAVVLHFDTLEEAQSFKNRCPRAVIVPMADLF